MNAYDAIVHLIKKHDDKTIYTQHTDRRIAQGLSEVYSRAEKEKALDELVFTLKDNPITNKVEKKLNSH